MIGDHIRARKGGRWTHAIDCGDETVIFLREDEGVLPADRIARSYRPEFVSAAESVEVVTHRERTYPPRQVVARAYSRTRDPALAAMFGDSEAFAEWCKTGRVLNGAYNYAVAVPGVPAAQPKPAAKARAKAAPRTKAKTASSAKAAAKASGARKAKPTAKAKAAPRRPARPVAKSAAKAKAKPHAKPTAKAKKAARKRASTRR